MELLKDYDYTIDYNLGKTNIVVDALSRKATSFLAYVQIIHLPLMVELKKMGIKLGIDYSRVRWASFQVGPTLIDRIQEAQFSDSQLMKIRNEVDFGQRVDFTVIGDETLDISIKLCVPVDE